MSGNVHNSLTLLLVTFSILIVVPVSKCQLSGSNNIQEDWGFTNVKQTTVRYTWIMNNYGLCCRNRADKVISPMFSAGPDDCKWTIHINPLGDSNIANKDYMALYLNLESCATKNAEFKLGLINDLNEEILVRSSSTQFQQNAPFGYAQYVLQTFLTDKENNLLKDDKLTVFCEITTLGGSDTVLGKQPAPSRHLVNDLELLLEDEDFSDVTLTVDGNKFRAHKGILAARSPVFRAIFEEAKNETCNNLVEITNVDRKILIEMLRYIYTNKVSNLHNTSSGLLGAAENYQLNDLKTLCENSLRTNLAIDNAVEYFILGDKYHAENLKMEARDFIVSRAADLADSPELLSLLSDNPSLAAEIFIPVDKSQLIS